MKPVSARALSDGVLAVSDDLSASLTRALSRAVSDTTKAIAASLRAGLFEEAKTDARALTFTKALAGQEKAIRKFTRSAALVGAGAIDNPTTSIMVNGAGFPWEVDKGAVMLMQNMISSILTRDLRRQLLDRIDGAARFQKAEPIDPNALANQINRFLRGEIRRVVDVSANIVGTRVSAYGMFYEARARGISRYRIDAVLDDRTTTICRNMHGREFRVEEAYTRTGTLLSTTDPAQQKALAPFPDIEKIRNASDAELQAMGVDTPPFHFLCRSVVTLIESKVEYDPINYSLFDAPVRSKTEAREWHDNLWKNTAAQIGYTKSQIEDVAYALAAAPHKAEDIIEGLFKTPPNNKKLADELEAAKVYTGGDYNSINSALRSNSVPYDYLLEDKTIENLTDLLDRVEVPEDVVVYRGVTNSGLWNRLKGSIGKSFQDDAFLSTSTEYDVARGFSSNDQVVQILVPKGSKGISVELYTTISYEMELLLQRGTQIRVLGEATITDSRGDTRTVLRVVVQGVGDRLEVKDLGKADLPVPESVVKDSDSPRADKFSWKGTDLRETVV